MKTTWGISANSHDAALAVFRGRELKFASHAERFSGEKNDAHLNMGLIDYALKYGEPDKIIWYENPLKKTARQLLAGQGWNHEENNIKNYLESFSISSPINYSSHHHSHAAAGYFTSGYSDATVLCIDSIGEFETLSIWKAKGTTLKRVYSQKYPHSIGLWYSAMTQRIGLKPNEDEYILMGMAAYGDPDRLLTDIYNDFIDTTVSSIKPTVKFKQSLHRGCKDWRPDLTSEQDMYDIAAATQKVYELMLTGLLSWCKVYTPSENLVLAGGCALNCSANSIAFNYYDNIWIMPNPGDAGSAVGAVLAHRSEHIDWQGPYLGYNISRPYPVEKLLAELSVSSIAGVANGRAEYGPRALGNRSLLADPRGGNVKDRVNEIKRRQKFRPFAPAILAEYADDYFTGPKGPYMQYTAKCKRPDLFPAIVHADGTSRVQTVTQEDNPGFHRLLSEWHRMTGCPILLNTSLNIKGKPMVNTLEDAEAFTKCYNVKVY